MKLLAIKLQNFRQFRGQQELRFSTDPEKNVTLVYGPNGGGKTTLLNAFVWALYGTFTEDLERSQELVHSDTWSATAIGEKVRVSVGLTFEHRDLRYEVERSLLAEKRSAEQNVDGRNATMRVFLTDARGATTTPENPLDLIDRILPEKLSKFFFFNGERIEALTKHSSYKSLAEATKTLLGLEVISRGIMHLPKAAKTYHDQLARASNTQAQDINRELSEISKRTEVARQSFEIQQDNKRSLETQLEVVEENLSQHAKTSELQNRRQDAEQARTAAEDRQRKQDLELRKIVGSNGYVAFATRLGQVVEAKFADLEAKGELPAPVKEPFVRQLLDENECICGASLDEGSTNRSRLEGFLKTAGSPELESTWTRLKHTAARFGEEREVLRGRLEATQAARDAAVEDERRANERYSEVSRLLQGIDDVDTRAMEERRNHLKAELSRCDQQIGALVSDEKRLKATKERLDAEFDKAAKQDEKSEELRECLRVADEARSALEGVQEALTEGVRQQLNRRISATYDRISARPRRPELSSDFELRLWEVDQGGVRRQAANSTSENTILALSFVGGLVDFARDQEQQAIGDDILQRLTDGSGGVFPLVIDAAFGSLDETYKLEVARALPKLTDQLIIFLSKAQAQGTVSELESRLGKQYVVVSHVSKDDRDEDIAVAGHSYAYRRVCRPGEEHAQIEELA